MKKSLMIMCCALLGLFLVIIAEILIPSIREILKGPLFLLPFIVFSLLGIALIFETKRTKQEGKRRRSLIITGISSAGILISMLLHNAFYGLGIIAKDISIVQYLFEGLHVIFFITAIFICPAAFLVGIVLVLIDSKNGDHRTT